MFLYMSDDEKKVICTATHAKKFHCLVTCSFLGEKKYLFLCAYTHGCFHLTPKNKESEELGVSQSQGDGLVTNSKQNIV